VQKKCAFSVDFGVAGRTTGDKVVGVCLEVGGFLLGLCYESSVPRTPYVTIPIRST
jgi:hypothetical protein